MSRGARRAIEEFFVWTLILATVAALIAVVTACQSQGLERTVASTELGYGRSFGQLDSTRADTWGADEESWSVWVTIHPLAALDPPRPVYVVDKPKEDVLTFGWPVGYEPAAVGPAVPAGTAWWRSLSEVQRLLAWIGGGIAAFILLVLGKVGLDKQSRRKRT